MAGLRGAVKYKWPSGVLLVALHTLVPGFVTCVVGEEETSSGRWVEPGAMRRETRERRQRENKDKRMWHHRLFDSELSTPRLASVLRVRITAALVRSLRIGFGCRLCYDARLCEYITEVRWNSQPERLNERQDRHKACLSERNQGRQVMSGMTGTRIIGSNPRSALVHTFRTQDGGLSFCEVNQR